MLRKKYGRSLETKSVAQYMLACAGVKRLNPYLGARSSPAPDKLMFYLYILKSLSDNGIYIGYTSDLKRRMQEHQSGRSLATKSRLPVKLVYYEAYLREKDARNRERKLKQYGKAIQILKGRIKESLS
jgi:putative endonuclease